MRNHKSMIMSLFVTLAIAGLAACASTGGGATGGADPSGDSILIWVTNDMSPPSGVEVWAVPEGGARRRLGFVSPNGRRSFSYSPILQSMQVYLVAVPEGPPTGTMGQQGDWRSNAFSVMDIQTVNWSVSRRNVRLER